MIMQLFVNACILITFISISYNFIENKDMKQNNPKLFKLLLGFGAGILGILLMLFGVQVTPTIITDFRALPILFSSLYGGCVPPIIASIIISTFRILYFGVSRASVIAVITILLMGIGFSAINLIRIKRKCRWWCSVIYALIVNSAAMVILITDPVLLFKVFAAFCTSTLLMSYFIFKYAEYLRESVHSNRKLKSEATVDFLTGLNNVRQFDTLFNRAAQQAMRNEECVSLLFLDIDYFKKVNDTYGHSSGDVILKELAGILQNTCRIYDIISRNGGEEFSVLLLNCPAYPAWEAAERIRRNVEAHKFYISEKVSINVTVSIGMATYPGITKSTDNLLENADTALYEAKRTGRNKVVLYKTKRELSN